MNYDQIEADILERLAPLSGATCEIVVLPEKQTDFKIPHDKNRITVAYKISKYLEPHSTAEIAQFEDVLIDVTIESRKLRGENSCYSLLDAVRKLLIGFRPIDCDRMHLKECGFSELEANLWAYSMTFVTRGMIVELDPEEVDVMISQIVMLDQYGNPVVDSNNAGTTNPPAPEPPFFTAQVQSSDGVFEDDFKAPTENPFIIPDIRYQRGAEPVVQIPFTDQIINIPDECLTLAELWALATTEEKSVLYLGLTDLERIAFQTALPDLDLLDLYEALPEERRLYLYRQITDAQRSFLFNGLDDDERLYLFVNLPAQDALDLYLGLTDAQRITLQAGLSSAQLFALYNALTDGQRVLLFQTLSAQNQLDIYASISDVERLALFVGLSSQDQIDLYVSLSDALRLSLFNALPSQDQIDLYSALIDPLKLSLFNALNNTQKQAIVYPTYAYDAFFDNAPTQFQTGDAKWIWDTYFKPVIDAFPTDKQIIRPILNPNDNTLLKRGNQPNGFNIWGTLDRYTDSLGGQTYANNVRQDHYLGIETYRTLQSVASTNGSLAISGALALNLAGHTDWFCLTAGMFERMIKRVVDTTGLNFAPFSHASFTNNRLYLSTRATAANTFLFGFTASAPTFGGANGTGQYMIARKM